MFFKKIKLTLFLKIKLYLHQNSSENVVALTSRDVNTTASSEDFLPQIHFLLRKELVLSKKQSCSEKNKEL